MDEPKGIEQSRPDTEGTNGTDTRDEQEFEENVWISKVKCEAA